VNSVSHRRTKKNDVPQLSELELIRLQEEGINRKHAFYGVSGHKTRTRSNDQSPNPFTHLRREGK
jgi:hypothetical protein